MASSRDPRAVEATPAPLSLRAAQVRQRLARGTYQIDLDAVAARLLDTLFQRR